MVLVQIETLPQIWSCFLFVHVVLRWVQTRTSKVQPTLKELLHSAATFLFLDPLRSTKAYQLAIITLTNIQYVLVRGLCATDGTERSSAIPAAPISQLTNDGGDRRGPLSPLCDTRHSSFPFAFSVAIFPNKFDIKMF